MSGLLLPSLPFGAAEVPIPQHPFRLDEIVPPRSRPAAGTPVELALDRPIASPPLGESFRGARRVLVVVSDGTRKTGSAEFLPWVVRRIHEATRAEIVFAVASGIHRPPTDEEIDHILGPSLRGRFPVLRHDPDSADLVEVGQTRAGTPVRVHPALRSHDRIVLTGAAGFHYYAGFSGGRKALVPGMASRETVSRNHLRSLTREGRRHPLARAGRLDGNPVHRDMVDGAALVGPHFLVNSVLDDAGRVERLFCGHWRRAHEAACRFVRATRCVRVSPRELVIASAGGEPSDLNLIQSHKAFEAAMGALRPGGVLVLVARCREGAGHPDFLPWFRFEREDDHVAELRRAFQVYGQTALSWIRKASSCRLILVSDLPASLVRSLRADPAADLAEALGLAARLLPAGTPGWLLASGSRLLVESDARG